MRNITMASGAMVAMTLTVTATSAFSAPTEPSTIAATGAAPQPSEKKHVANVKWTPRAPPVTPTAPMEPKPIGDKPVTLKHAPVQETTRQAAPVVNRSGQTAEGVKPSSRYQWMKAAFDKSSTGPTSPGGQVQGQAEGKAAITPTTAGHAINSKGTGAANGRTASGTTVKTPPSGLASPPVKHPQ